MLPDDTFRKQTVGGSTERDLDTLESLHGDSDEDDLVPNTGTTLLDSMNSDLHWWSEAYGDDAVDNFFQDILSRIGPGARRDLVRQRSCSDPTCFAGYSSSKPASDISYTLPIVSASPPLTPSQLVSRRKSYQYPHVHDERKLQDVNTKWLQMHQQSIGSSVSSTVQPSFEALALPPEVLSVLGQDSVSESSPEMAPKLPMGDEAERKQKLNSAKVVQFQEVGDQMIPEKNNDTQPAGAEESFGLQHGENNSQPDYQLDPQEDQPTSPHHTRIRKFSEPHNPKLEEPITRINFRASLPHVDVSMANDSGKGSSLGFILNGAQSGSQTATAASSSWRRHPGEFLGTDHVHSGAWTSRSSWRGIQRAGDVREWSLGPMSPSQYSTARGGRYASNFSTTSSTTLGGTSHNSVSLGWQPGEHDQPLEFESVLDLLGELVTFSPDSGDEHADLSCDTFLFFYSDYCTTRELVEGVVSVVFNLLVEYAALTARRRGSEDGDVASVEQMTRNALQLLFRWVNSWNGGRILKQFKRLRLQLLRFLKALSRCHHPTGSMAGSDGRRASLPSQCSALGGYRDSDATVPAARATSVSHGDPSDSDVRHTRLTLFPGDLPPEAAGSQFSKSSAAVGPEREVTSRISAELRDNGGRRTQSLWSHRSHTKSIDNDWSSARLDAANSDGEGLGPLPRLSTGSLGRLSFSSPRRTVLASSNLSGSDSVVKVAWVKPEDAIVQVRAWSNGQMAVEAVSTASSTSSFVNLEQTAPVESSANKDCVPGRFHRGSTLDSDGGFGSVATDQIEFPAEVCELAQRLYRILVASAAFALAEDKFETASFASVDDYFFDQGTQEGEVEVTDHEDLDECPDGQEGRLGADPYDHEELDEDHDVHEKLNEDYDDHEELNEDHDVHEKLNEDYDDHEELNEDHENLAFAGHRNKTRRSESRSTGWGCEDEDAILSTSSNTWIQDHQAPRYDDQDSLCTEIASSTDSEFSDYQYDFHDNAHDESNQRWSLPGPHQFLKNAASSVGAAVPKESPAGTAEQVALQCLRWAERGVHHFTIHQNPFHSAQPPDSNALDVEDLLEPRPEVSRAVSFGEGLSTSDSAAASSNTARFTLRRAATIDDGMQPEDKKPGATTPPSSRRNSLAGSISKGFRRVRSLTGISALASASQPSQNAPGMGQANPLAKHGRSGVLASTRAHHSFHLAPTRQHSTFHLPGKLSFGSPGSTSQGWNGRVKSLPRSFTTGGSGPAAQVEPSFPAQPLTSKQQQQVHAHKLLASDPRALAQQLTLLMYQTAYQHIQPHMLMHPLIRHAESAHGGQAPEQSWPVKRMYQYFLVLSWWAPTEVLANTLMSASTRINLLGYFVNFGEELRQLRNYHGVFAVVAGLCQPMLGWVWAIAHKRDKERFLVLKRVISTAHNYRVYRADLSKCDKSQPIIPYLGLVNRTLETLNRSRVMGTKQHAENPNGNAAKDDPGTRKINFGLCKRLYSAIASFLVGQAAPYWEAGLRVDTRSRGELASSLSCTIPDFAVLSELSALAKHKFHRRKRERAFHGIRTGARSLQKSVSVTMRG